MTAAFFLALQAAASPATVPAGVSPISFDLNSVGRPHYDPDDPIAFRRCARGDGTAIVVCGRRAGGDYPMAQWALIFPTEGPLRAETRLDDGVTGRIHAESVGLDRGAVSQRAMVGVSIAF